MHVLKQVGCILRVNRKGDYVLNLRARRGAVFKSNRIADFFSERATLFASHSVSDCFRGYPPQLRTSDAPPNSATDFLQVLRYLSSFTATCFADNYDYLILLQYL